MCCHESLPCKFVNQYFDPKLSNLGSVLLPLVLAVSVGDLSQHQGFQDLLKHQDSEREFHLLVHDTSS